MLKSISKQMYEGSFLTRLVIVALSMILVSVASYIVYAFIFFLLSVLGLGAFLVSGMVGILLVVTAMVKYPQKQEYSEYAKKRM